MTSIKIFCIVALSLICAGSLWAQTVGKTTSSADTAQTFSLIPSLDTKLMDTAADPCVDFYRYACGNWAKLHPIPADSPYSDEFYILEQYNLQVLHTILEKAAADNASRDANTQKIGDYYASCAGESAVHQKGLAPLKSELDRIDALTSKDQLPALLAHYQLIGVNAFFGLGSDQDFKDATQMIAVVQQGGLGLPGNSG